MITIPDGMVPKGVSSSQDTLEVEEPVMTFSKFLSLWNNSVRFSSNMASEVSWDIIAMLQSIKPWWRHQIQTFSALLAICAGNSPVLGEFPTQRPVTRSFDVYFDLRLNKWLCKQSWGWWFETLLYPLWRHSNALYRCVQIVDPQVW